MSSGNILPSYHDSSKSRLDRVKRGRDLVGAIGVRQGLQLIREHRRNPNSGLIFSRKFEGLAKPFFMTAAQGDLAVVTEILVRGRYHLEDKYRVLVGNLPVIDAGANIGASSVFFANQHPNSLVIAVEPNSRNMELLSYNAKQYGDRILPIESALAIHPGLVGLNNPEVGGSGHHEAYQYLEATETLEGDPAKALTPGELINALVSRYGFDRIGILKLSIKGAESRLLDSTVMDKLFEMANIVILGNGDPAKLENKQAIVDAARRCGHKIFDQRGQFHFLVNDSATST